MHTQGYASAYAVGNPALTLTLAISTERGKELDEQIWDAQTRYIMGKMDDAGWQAEVHNWRKSGGDTLTQRIRGGTLSWPNDAPQM
ncbi:hypothetical protein [Paenibacillus xerothermodurans]|uniref:hypothetical protein n=1 Tax=Paenibacillus xerothermodurans TaxID=1977292 RepID=UPI000B77B318|nr:hypothetical protein [Paenibacillus xerothermodurans]